MEYFYHIHYFHYLYLDERCLITNVNYYFYYETLHLKIIGLNLNLLHNLHPLLRKLEMNSNLNNHV
jgi:hypothetical protein